MMNILTKILPFLLLINSFLVLSQETTYESGELLVMLNKDAKISHFLEGLTQDYPAYNTQVKESISKELNVWLVSFSNIEVANFQELALNYPQVLVAQPNHNNVALRGDTTPTDPGFGNQWHHNNIGQFGGQVGADMSSTEAWGISHSNLSALGDTLVVAVIDDGFFLGHNDINFFKNYQEIPNNQIDDDGNGFTDDVQGWNAYLDSGAVSSNSHGTHVSGISGAKANNGLGGVGVNWGVKILPVQSGVALESVVLKAYDYVLKMRKLYDETSGAKGAFVVATNSSFGIDYANAASFPLWCAFYDSLGAYGILNCGATSNSNINVDASGDIPTTCSSDYLISVTNTDRNDTKVTAGFGATHIDIGAPGTSIYSTLPGNSYGNRSGTSMSTPQVAGAIALMHSIGCANFASEYKARPDSMALVIKRTLMDFGDSLLSLQGITVSGNRLNVRKAGYEIRTSGACSLTSIPKLEVDDSKLELFPNPTSGNINLRLTGFVRGGYALEIYSVEGKLIESSSLMISEESQLLNKPLHPEIEEGVYLLCLRSYFSSPKTIRFVVNK
jgi:hypothetical protein